MTIPGVDMAVAVAIVATVGDFSRFESPDKLVSYVGLNPSVRQSGGLPATHGRISKQGRAWARGMLVEAAHAASHTPGPLHGFFERVKARRGWQIATVAVARKLLVICWHMIHDQRDYASARPSLVAKKTRALELRAGAPAHRGHPAGIRRCLQPQNRPGPRTSSRASRQRPRTTTSPATGNRPDRPARRNQRARNGLANQVCQRQLPGPSRLPLRAAPPALTALPPRLETKNPRVTRLNA